MAGEPSLVVVSGEPGIGKTRLVSELAATAHDAGSTVVYGRSEEELDIPFRPWAEALQHLVTHQPAEVLADHVADWDAAIARLVPSVGTAPVAGSDPDSERLRLFGAVVDLLARAGEEAPVVVVLDDLHWADESSLLLLRHVVRHKGTARLLLVGTYRDTDLARSHPLAAALADLRRESGVERVALTGLDRDEVEAFLTLAGGGEVNADDVVVLAGMVSAETEGNPFFIGEVLAHLVESGALVQHDGRWQGDQSLIEQIGLPEGIREVVGRRLADLPEATNELLRAAAVVGPAFDAAVVASALDQEVDTVLAGIDDAVTRRLVVESDEALDRFRFAHALVRQTLLEEVTTSRRVRFHHRVALALEARSAPAADLAHHFGEAAALADADKAVAYAGQAADEATERLAYEQAIRFRLLAVEAEELIQAPDPARRAELRLGLGQTRNTAGQTVEGRNDFVAAAAAAREAGRPDLLARAAVGYGGEGAVWLDFADTTGPALLDEALAALPATTSSLRAQALAQRSMWRLLDRDPTERLALTEAAAAMAEETGDLDALYLCLAARANALTGVGDVEVLLAVARRVAEIARASDDEPLRFQALYYELVARVVGDELDAARAAVAAMQAADWSRLNIASRWNLASNLANIALLEGRWSDVIGATAEEAAAFGKTGAAVFESHQVWLRWSLGDMAEAAAAQRAIVAEHADIIAPWPNLAWSDWIEGNRDAAIAGLREWHGGMFGVIPAAFRVNAIAYAVPMVVDLGVAELYDDFVAELRPLRGTWATWTSEVATWLVDHVLGLLDLAFGDRELGEEELRTSIAAYRRGGVRGRLVHALADLAVMTGDEAARKEALALADELAMKAVTARLTP